MKRRLQDNIQSPLPALPVGTDAGSRLQRTALHSALLAAIGLGTAAPLAFVVAGANAAQVSTSIGVSVNVIAGAALQTDYQADRLSVSLSDVARGYVDAPGGSRFSVRTNAAAGYLMVFYPVGDLFESVRIGGLKTFVHLGREGGVAVQRGLPVHGLVHDLSFRFFLNARTLPGDYPWPLHLSARALE